jgi:hypothetical protein
MTETEFRNQALMIKGEVIDNMAMMEYLMNFLLADYMSNKNTKFGMAVMNKLNFNAKIEMVKYFLEYKKVDLKNNYPTLLKGLSDMQTLRNKFAHSIIKIDPKVDYDKNDSFYMMDSYKFNTNPISKISYNLKEHGKNTMKISMILHTLTKLSGHKAFKKTRNKKLD